MNVLYVVNQGDTEFTDRFNGVDYHLPPGKTVSIDHEAARHFFGYGESDKTRALTRQGVIRMVNEVNTVGAEWLSKFRFQEVEPPPPPDLMPKVPRSSRGLDGLMEGAKK